MKSILFTAAAIVLLCQQPARSFDEKSLTSPEELMPKLARRSQWDFPGNPLEDVLEFVQKIHKIDIDYGRVEKAKLSLDVEIQTFGSGPVYVMLGKVLGTADIEYLAIDEKIVLIPVGKKRREAQLKNASPELQKTLSYMVLPIEFPGNPIADVLEYLVLVTSVPIFIDKQSLESAGKSEATSVKAICFGSLVTILDEVLTPEGLTWKAKGDRIVIQAAKAKKTTTSKDLPRTN